MHNAEHNATSTRVRMCFGDFKSRLLASLVRAQKHAGTKQNFFDEYSCTRLFLK